MCMYEWYVCVCVCVCVRERERERGRGRGRGREQSYQEAVISRRQQSMPQIPLLSILRVELIWQQCGSDCVSEATGFITRSATECVHVRHCVELELICCAREQAMDETLTILHNSTVLVANAEISCSVCSRAED